MQEKGANTCTCFLCAQCPAKFFKLADMWHYKLQVSDSFLLFLGLCHGLRF